MRNFSLPAKFLNASTTSFSIVAVAPPSLLDALIGVGAVGGFCWLLATTGVVGFSAVGFTAAGVGGSCFVTLSGLDEADSLSLLATLSPETSSLFEAFLASGRASEADMMAGSTGAPATVGWLVGGRRAGGVYLFGCPVGSGGKLVLRLTPLYL